MLFVKALDLAIAQLQELRPRAQREARAAHRRAKLAPPRLKLLLRRGKLKVYLVNATAVRKMTRANPNAPDFTMGTGDQVWPEVTGRNEIWISDELLTRPHEMKATMLHEMTERRRMLRDGLSYDEAHAEALAVENHYRQARWAGLDAALRRERGQ